MDKNEIAALLESLAERPLAERPPEISVESQADYWDAARTLAQTGDDSSDDSDRLTAALAAVLSDMDDAEARGVIATAAARSAAVRLDAESALAFVDSLEQAPLTAPAHLVEQAISGDAAPAASHNTAGGTGFWSALGPDGWSARRWRVAAAGAVLLLVAGGLSWSLYRLPSHPDVGAAWPATKTTVERPAVGEVAVQPKPELAITQPCEPRSQVTAIAADTPPAKSADQAGGNAGCAAGSGSQIADRPANELEAIAARHRAEAAHQAAAAAAAAGKVGTAAADRSPIEPGRFGPATQHPAAAATARPTIPPAATPAARPAMK